MKSILNIIKLNKTFETNFGPLLALDDINFEIYEGETLGLVGESGSGKSTLGRLISKIYDCTKGEILYKGRNINSISKLEFSKIFQMIFQDPYSSLNPRMNVGKIVSEGLDIHKENLHKEKIVSNLLKEVGLDDEAINKFPHEFSGGQRQRIGIARALALKPKFIVCDEPISALDVSIQAQIINLLKKLQNEHKLTYLFISHDLRMVNYISDRIAVMYKGRIVEIGKSQEIISNPLHIYTKTLINSIPPNSFEKIRIDVNGLKNLDFSKGSLQKIKKDRWVYK